MEPQSTPPLVVQCESCHATYKVIKLPANLRLRCDICQYTTELTLETVKAERGWAQPLLGRELGGCKIEEILSEGRNTAVFRADQLSMNRDVVVKVLSPSASDGPAFRNEFIRQAKLVAQILHTGIANILDVGEANGMYYYSMEYCRGRSLQAILRDRKVLRRADAISILIELCAAVDVAVNRSAYLHVLPPDKVILTEKSGIKILPSAFSSQGFPSDSVRALGLLMLEMLTGQPPSAEAQQGRIAPEVAVPGTTQIDQELRLCLLGSIARTGVSFPSISSFREKLEPLVQQLKVQEGEAASILRSVRPRKRLSFILSGIATVLILALCAETGLILYKRAAAEQEREKMQAIYQQFVSEVTNQLRLRKYEECDRCLQNYLFQYPDSPYAPEVKANREKLAELIKVVKEIEKRKTQEMIERDGAQKAVLDQWKTVREKVARLTRNMNFYEAYKTVEVFLPKAAAVPYIKQRAQLMLDTILAYFDRDWQNTRAEALQLAAEERFPEAVNSCRKFVDRWQTTRDTSRRVNELSNEIQKRANDAYQVVLRRAREAAANGDFELGISYLAKVQQSYGIESIVNSAAAESRALSDNMQKLDIEPARLDAERQTVTEAIKLPTSQVAQMLFDQAVKSFESAEKSVGFVEFKTRLALLRQTTQYMKDFFQTFVDGINNGTVKGSLKIGTEVLPFISATMTEVRVGQGGMQSRKIWIEVDSAMLLGWLRKAAKKPEDRLGLFAFCAAKGLTGEALTALSESGLGPREVAPFLFAWNQKAPKQLNQARIDYEAQLYLKCAVIEHLAGRKRVATQYLNKIRADLPDSAAARILPEFGKEFLRKPAGQPRDSAEKARLLADAEKSYAELLPLFRNSLAKPDPQLLRKIDQTRAAFAKILELDKDDPIVQKRLSTINMMRLATAPLSGG